LEEIPGQITVAATSPYGGVPALSLLEEIPGRVGSRIWQEGLLHGSGRFALNAGSVGAAGEYFRILLELGLK